MVRHWNRLPRGILGGVQKASGSGAGCRGLGVGYSDVYADAWTRYLKGVFQSQWFSDPMIIASNKKQGYHCHLDSMQTLTLGRQLRVELGKTGKLESHTMTGMEIREWGDPGGALLSKLHYGIWLQYTAGTCPSASELNTLQYSRQFSGVTITGHWQTGQPQGSWLSWGIPRLIKHKEIQGLKETLLSRDRKVLS